MYLLPHDFCAAQLGWVFCKAAIRYWSGLGSHQEAQLGKDTLTSSLMSIAEFIFLHFQVGGPWLLADCSLEVALSFQRLPSTS